MDEDARVLSCGQCGAAIPPASRRCPYCLAAVFSRHCGSCFHANLADAEHCAGCGRELGLEPLPEPAELRCPVCEGGFGAIATGAGALFDCSGCGGQFLEHATLHRLLEERLRVPDAGRRSMTPPLSGPIRYLPCPVCAVRMNRKNFGDHSGVIVDVCRGHGVWFDAGELPRVLAFVERGGLEAAARRAADEERERRVAQRTSMDEVHLAPSIAPWRPDVDDDLGRLISSVLTILRL